ncbi:MAG: protein kinase [Gemmataceae bacterium]|nr:protein kinase [Gemmataceae bacterium]
MDPISFGASDPLRPAAESFVRRLRRGERPHLAEYVERMPDQANRIRELFPKLLASERRVGEDATTGPFGPLDDQPNVPKTIGDYLIVREIARGGMGIVYEAVQASLGRQVALKVLPSGPCNRGAFLDRFRREARAAARLHHTNIVPVYGVGDADGLHYYAMQYIEGMGLDAVVKEVRRRRGLAPIDIAQATHTLDIQTRTHESADQGGEFELGPTSILPTVQESSSQLPAAAHGGEQLTFLADHIGSRYFRSIARLGVQAAEALAYAHDQGVLHRDVKPSNILLDKHGIVWITDFGLAKLEGDDLTGTGDIVGTLRYMAPERFKALSDSRSDVYALGMTLYEMIALQPAFEDDDRLRMVERINSEKPKRLGVLAPGCPRDLETIILKSIAKDPADRYLSAAELADDLRRFLTDRPIKARRASALEELRRWCRRNPAVTGLTGLLMLMLVAIVAIVVNANFSLRYERDEVANAKRRAESIAADSNDRLWNSQVTAARLRRSLHASGQRFAALESIAEARRIRQDPILTAQAAASLALPDIRRVNGWEGWPTGTVSADIDPKFERFVRTDRQGAATIRSVIGDTELCVLPGLGGPAKAQFSKTGKYLTVTQERDGRLNVWAIGDDNPVELLGDSEASNVTAWAFTSNDRSLVCGRIDGTLNEYELPGGRLIRSIVVGPGVSCIDSHPIRPEIVVCTGDEVATYDCVSGQEGIRFAPPTGAVRVAWHPDGQRMAVAAVDGRIHIHRRPGQSSVLTLEGHRDTPADLLFHPDGGLLVSTGADRMIRMWDPYSGRLLLSMPAVTDRPRFDESGRYLAPEIEGNRLNVLQVAAGLECRTLYRRGSPVAFRDGAVDSKGKLLAVATSDGVTLWDLATGEELALLPSGETIGCLFTPGGDLLTSGARGVFSWPITRVSDGWQAGPPRLLAAIPGERIARSSDGAVTAVATKIQGAIVVDSDRPTIRNPLLFHELAAFVSVSPDGKWIATGSQGGSMVRIWNAQTNRLERELDVPSASVVSFSPDGQLLATNVDGTGIQLWRTSDWTKERLIPAERFSRVAFSPDGRMLAVETGEGTIRLVNPLNGRELTILEDSDRDRASWLGFTEDGARLVAVGNDSRTVHVWDLARLRVGLRGQNLDWTMEPFPELPSIQSTVNDMTVIGSELLDPVVQARWRLALATLGVMSHPTEADFWVRRGSAFADLGMESLALADYSRALEIRPDHAEASYLRGLEYFRQRQFEPALDDFSRAQSRPALADVAGWMRGKAMLQLDRVEEMMAAVNALIEHYPNDPQLFYQRALGHAYRGRHAAAIADLELALRKSPSHDAALNNLAWVLATGPDNIRDPERGLGLVQRAVRLAPQKGTYQNTLGVCLLRLGRYREAAAAFEKSLAFGRGQFDGYDLFFLSMCQSGLNDSDRALSSYERGCRWQQTTRLTPHEKEELERFRREAEQSLGR